MNIDRLKNDPRMPKHIALIIDGNGRWAKKHGWVRTIGHKYGFENLKRQVEFVQQLGIKTLSMYCFSAENWNRPEKEVNYLMELFNQMLDEYLQQYLNRDVKILFSGDLTDERLPKQIREKSAEIMQKTQEKTGFILNICINYGGKQEILKAVNECLKQGESIIDEQMLEKHLYTAGLLPLDLVIRTSGEQRSSNFMIWQSAYSEWCYPKVFWPAFSKKDLIKALKNYMSRDRRYGAIKEDK